MNFLIKKRPLYQSLQKIVSIISSRSRLPVLNHVLLELSKDCLFITATDLEIEIVGKLFPEKIYSTGSSTVSGRKFFEICRGFSEYSKILVELKNNKLIISSGSSNFSLSTFFTSDFPTLESWTNITEFKMSQVILKKMIELTQFAMGNQDVRHYLNGMFFEIKDHIVRIVTTDGHRLATCAVFIDTLSLFQSMIVPRKSVLEILHLLSIEKKPSLVNIQTNNNNIRLEINDYVITSKLIDAIFPECCNIFPKKSVNVLEVLCDNLKNALKRAAIISNEKFRIVRFVLIDNFLKIIARNVENEVSEEILDVVYSGKNIEISFNINYLLDVLNVIDTQFVRFSFTDASSSVQIEGITKFYDEMYIVMPIRI